MSTAKKIGRYEVKSKLGEGGMGEVFLAHDDDLDREVAIKILLPEFCSNTERLNRFKLEAKAASALNHPNIITIFEIGSDKENIYIVTECIKGETLRSALQRGAVTPESAIEYALQIASALTAAHKEGIVHRDIKPENIMVREDGIIKVLDFGLAKPTQVDAEAKTLELVKTKAGMVLGSVGYMSPEQARGKEVDNRTDVWSLGVVLYEMLTGQTPFDGETVTDILANIIHKEPVPISEYLSEAPGELQRILQKALQKNRDERYQTAKDFSIDLKNLRREFGFNETDGFMTGQFKPVSIPTTSIKLSNTQEAKTLIHQSISSDKLNQTNSSPVQQSQAFRKRNWVIPIGIVCLAILIAIGAWFYRPAVATDWNSLEVSTLEGSDKAFAPTISADGKYLAFINYENGKKSLAVRQIATGSTVPIVSSLESGGFLQPTFSPDGNHIYYIIAERGMGTLYQIPSLGGTAKKIVQDIDSRVTFSPDGKQIAFMRRNAENGLNSVIIANNDGTNEQIFITSNDLNAKRIYEIAWAPKENQLLVASMEEFLIDELIKSKLFLVSVKDKTIRQFGEREWLNASSFQWTKDGLSVLMLARSGTQEPSQIWQVSYPDGKEVRRITNDSNGFELMSYAPEAGIITASKNTTISSLWTFNPTNKELNQVTSDSKNLVGAGGIAFYPDGKLLVSKIDGNKANLWTFDADGKNEKQFTSEEGFNSQASVSADGKYVVYASTRTKFYSIWRTDFEGKNPTQLTIPTDSYDSKPIILHDNKTVIFERRSADFTKSTLMKISLDGGEATALFPQETAMQMFPSISNDGKLLAISTSEFDKTNNKFNREIKIYAVNEGGIGELKHQIKTSLGYYYRFSPDNKNLTYINQQGVDNIYNFPMDDTQPKPITNFSSGHILNFAWTKEGKKLYIVRGIINNEVVLLKNNSKG